MLEIFLVALLFSLLMVIAAVVPLASSKSIFELERRAKTGNASAMLELQRVSLRTDILSLQRVKLSVLIVAFVLCSIWFFGWFVGGIIAVVGALQYGSLARLPFIKKSAARLYNKYERHILSTVGKYQKTIWWLRGVSSEIIESRVASKAELEHIVETAGSVLSDDEKKRIVSSLSFDDRIIKDIMTPRSSVKTIKKTELLGPLVLDTLHKSGHSRFPVVQGDIDHIVGTLYLRDVLVLDTARKHTSTVETAMDKRVNYINEDQCLTDALNAFLKTHHHMFIVVNKAHETVGILSLEDTVEALLGSKIVDQLGSHDNLESVASRHPHTRHAPTDAKDV